MTEREKLLAQIRVLEKALYKIKATVTVYRNAEGCRSALAIVENAFDVVETLENQT